MRNMYRYDFVGIIRPMSFDEQNVDDDAQNGSDVRSNNRDPEPVVVIEAI